MSIKVISPKGIAKYPSLIRPDTRYNAEGVYKTGLIVSADEAADLRAQLEEEFINEFGKAKLAKATLPIKPVLDEEGNETDKVELTFKTKNQPKFFDAKGNPIMDEALEALDKLGGGSKLRISGAAKAYNAGGKLGVSMYLNSVQVITLVEYGGSGAFKAEDEEDGFEVAPKAAAPKAAPKAPPAAAADDGDIDF